MKILFPTINYEFPKLNISNRLTILVFQCIFSKLRLWRNKSNLSNYLGSKQIGNCFFSKNILLSLAVRIFNWHLKRHCFVSRWKITWTQYWWDGEVTAANCTWVSPRLAIITVTKLIRTRRSQGIHRSSSLLKCGHGSSRNTYWKKMNSSLKL